MQKDNEEFTGACSFCNKGSDDYIMESKNFAVIYNISPILPGHVLVIPKKHVESLFELTDDEVAEFMLLGRDAAKLLAAVFDTDAFNWAIQEREAAGQSVAHLHMHLVPRIIGDLVNPGDWFQELERSASGDIDTYNRFQLSQQQLDELTDKLKTAALELNTNNSYNSK
jgi:bis(5'-adenosyl)-triphosphatase